MTFDASREFRIKINMFDARKFHITSFLPPSRCPRQRTNVKNFLRRDIVRESNIIHISSSFRFDAIQSTNGYFRQCLLSCRGRFFQPAGTPLADSQRQSGGKRAARAYNRFETKPRKMISGGVPGVVQREAVSIRCNARPDDA